MSKRFTIKIEGKVFESDENGLLNLNDIWRGCGLSESKRPSEWKSKVFNELQDSGNIRRLKNVNQGKGEAPFYLWGTEHGAVAYSMWVSTNFYIQVLNAFVALRNGNLEEAVLLAGSTMSKEDEYLLVKFAAMKGLCFTKSCWYANIHHPNKLLTYLKKNPNWKYFSENKYGRLYATEEGVEKGYTYNCYGEWDTEKVVMRFTQKGREMLRQHNQHFNKKVEESFDRL